MSTIEDGAGAYVRLFITSKDAPEGTALGKGVMELLEGVQSSGSLNKAAKDLGMAYSKAWRLINHSEEIMGTLLIKRDGARGSMLTREGAAILDSYHAVEDRANVFVTEQLRSELKLHLNPEE